MWFRFTDISEIIWRSKFGFELSVALNKLICASKFMCNLCRRSWLFTLSVKIVLLCLKKRGKKQQKYLLRFAKTSCSDSEYTGGFLPISDKKSAESDLRKPKL